MSEDDRGKAGSIFRALEFASVGLEMGISVALGAAFGWWLDSRFGTKPWLLLVFSLVGVVAGFRALIVAARKARRQLSSSNGSTEASGEAAKDLKDPKDPNGPERKE